MDRRNFLKGVLGGVTATGVIVATSPQEIDAFASPLARDAPVVLDVPTSKSAVIDAGEHLYNADGELVAILTGVTIIREKVDVTGAFDKTRIYVPGSLTFQITAEGVGALEWRAPGLSDLKLRGVSR